MIENEHDVHPVVEVGERKEFSVWVDGRCVAKRGWFGVPREESILRRVRKEVARITKRS